MMNNRPYYKTYYTRPIDDLLFDQRNGKFLTPDEKKRLKEYAEEQRKKKLKNK